MRTLLVALLFGLPILGHAADVWPASNWVWQLPPEQRPFSGLLTDSQFRRVIRELEGRDESGSGDFFRVSNRHDPYGNGFLYPANPAAVVGPRKLRSGIEAAESLNSLRMDRYRQDCEKLKHSQMHGMPALYPTQIPWLGKP